MKEKLNIEFKNNCYQEIEEILEEVKEYMPKIEIWQMNQSVYIEDNKKVLCKAILDKNEKCIGHKIKIDLLLDVLYKYRLNILENSIELTKTYFIEGNHYEELFKLTKEKETIKKMYIYKENDKYIKYQNIYDKKTNNEEKISFNDIKNKIKGNLTYKEKVRKL